MIALITVIIKNKQQKQIPKLWINKKSVSREARGQDVREIGRS